MKKVLLVPDSFKGTMSSAEICSVMENTVKAFYPNAQIISIPVADGGEGSVDAFLSALGGEKKTVYVQGPFFDHSSPEAGKVKSFFGILPDTTAVIEMAACAGLPLAGDKKNPAITTTYGAGELIKAALDSGCRKIILCIGGSATNDGCCGAAAALGVKFLDADGSEFIPVGGTLHKIAHIEKSSLDIRIKDTEIITMCDVDNPLYGESGAAHIFAPQKGADPQMVEFLDAGLRHLAEIVKKDLNLDFADEGGAGAAGGMGYGMKMFFGSNLQMGIDTVLDIVNFDGQAKDADCVFTGEGKIDSQSLSGKAVIGIARRLKKINTENAVDIPLVAVVGTIGSFPDNGIEAVYNEGVTAVFCINSRAEDFANPALCARNNLALTMNNILRLWSHAK